MCHPIRKPLFSSDKNIDAVSGLLREVRHYADLRLKHLKLDFVDKLTVLLSALLIAVVLLVILAVALLFLAYTLALALAPHVGGTHWACALVAAACLCFAAVFYALRRRLVVRPLTNFIARLFLSEDDEAAAEEDEADGRRKREEDWP